MTAISSFPEAMVEHLVDIADFVLAHIDGAAHVTVSVVDNDRRLTTLIARPDAEPIPEASLSEGSPALAALLSRRIARIHSTANRNSTWPEYSRACSRQGIFSVSAFPILDRGEVRGVLTIGSHDYCGFGPAETRMGQQAAADIATILCTADLGYT
jgi:hypothetical protein